MHLALSLPADEARMRRALILYPRIHCLSRRHMQEFPSRRLIQKACMAQCPAALRASPI